MVFNQCIPDALGVPFEGGQPPNWLAGPTRVDTTLDDVRWRGAGQQVLGDNGSDEASFRAVFHTDAATNLTNLHLSWQVRLDMDNAQNSFDQLYVGFIPDASGSGPAFAVGLTLNIQQGQGGTKNGLDQPNFSTQVFTRSAGANPRWNDGHAIGTTGALGGTWLTDTRVWADSPTTIFSSLPNRSTIPWAFQMKIPLNTEIVQEGPIGGGTGLKSKLGTSFKMWYSFVVGILDPLTGLGKQLTWPNSAGTEFFVTAARGLPDPDPNTWGSVTVGNCSAQGVSLSFAQIGTTNANSSDISLNNKNTLFANPTNNSTVPILANTLFARFRLANWGSMFTGATWDDIRGGSSVKNSSDIPAGTTLPAATPAIHFDWTLNDTERAKYQQGGSLNTHQCMLVELTSTAPISFDNDSVFHNMNFKNTSLAIEDAHISLGGLPPTQNGHRDVYLYVERVDLPSHIESDPCRFDREEENVEERRAELNRRAQEGNLTLAEAAEIGLPAYRVHVYHSTGQKLVLGGKERDMLHVQPSFGYFLLHEGPLFGWDHRLEGAEQIAPNYYKIPAIPDGQSAKVTVSVEALEQPRGAKDSGFMVQSTVGRKGDFILVVPDPKAGLSECIRSNDDLPDLPWGQQRTFGADVGIVESVSLIQSNFGPRGSLEVVARVGDRLVHFWRSASPFSDWNGPTTIVAQGVSGNPALIQGRFGKRGNFELVVPLASGGIVHYWRDNENPASAWLQNLAFATDLGHVDAVALIQSNFDQALGGNLEVIARVGQDLYHFWRDSNTRSPWNANGKFFSGATGIPGFIQSNYGSKGNFELVTPLVKGGMAHLQRNNDKSAAFLWTQVAAFGSGQVTAVSLLQSNFTTSTDPNVPGPGDFEVAARVDGRTALYWHRDTAPFDWVGPQAYACS